MNRYKNFFKSKTILACIAAIILALLHHNGVQIPNLSDEENQNISSWVGIAEKASILLAMVFRFTAKKELVL